MPQAKAQSILRGLKDGRQSVRDVAGEGLAPIRSLTLEELKGEWTRESMILAVALNGLSCDIHEDCDGTCLSVPHNLSVPLTERLVFDLFSMSLGLTSPHLSRATALDAPRDVEWLERQDLPQLEYSAINSLAGEIRLLRLKKGLFRSDIVECDLITTTLGGDQKFQALSYRWNAATTKAIMLCNGKKLNISPSLNAALKTFRESPELRNQLLWCDAVSIHQANLIEVSE